METKVEWDESKAQDKEFLIAYYQQRADRWKGNKKAKKTFKHFQDAVNKLKKEI